GFKVTAEARGTAYGCQLITGKLLTLWYIIFDNIFFKQLNDPLALLPTGSYELIEAQDNVGKFRRVFHDDYPRLRFILSYGRCLYYRAIIHDSSQLKTDSTNR